MNFTVQGMFFGDEGKGSIVDALCRKYDIKQVVRWCGGSQAGHNVVMADGRHHTFSQWGSGTLAGVPTHLGPGVVIYPEAMEREAEHLKEIGVKDPWAMLTVSPDCLVTTPYTRSANRHLETNRGNFRHGSCGHGIGETHRLNDDHTLCIPAFHLRFPSVVQILLNRQCRRYWEDNIDLSLVDCTDAIESYARVASQLNLTDVVKQDGLVYEGSQGTLLDQYAGFFPHVTRGRVLPTKAIRETSTVIGVTRTYITRHGVGPLDTERDMGFCDHRNPHNEWQGALRYGDFDMNLLKRSMASCPVDVLAVNHLDEHYLCTSTLGVPMFVAGNGSTANDKMFCENVIG